jgi:large subunit ribosomal protein L21
MYAIVETGSKQYKVSVGDRFKVEKLESGKGSQAILNRVLMIHDKELHLGNPYLPKAQIICDVIETYKEPRVIIFKFKRRKGYQRKKGHRQAMTLLKVREIHLEGTAKVAPAATHEPLKKAAAKKILKRKTVTKKTTTKKK